MGKCEIRKVHKSLNDVYFAFAWNFIKKRNLRFFLLKWPIARAHSSNLIGKACSAIIIVKKNLKDQSRWQFV